MSSMAIKGHSKDGQDGISPEIHDLIKEYELVVEECTPSRLLLTSAGPCPPGLADELAFLSTRRVEINGPQDIRLTESSRHRDLPPALPKVHPAPIVAGPVITVVDEVIRRAVSVKASDIHVEPGGEGLRVRYRIDGVLREIGRIGKESGDAAISRIKIMASLDIAEKRRPQDGRFSINDEGAKIDVRVSTLPTSRGEKVVMRLLDRRGVANNLEEIGFFEEQLRIFRRELYRPHGMILVTGPTGSGKTTTLYAALSELNTDDRNILTVEDPVEYQLEGISQTHVHADIGLTFASALRAFLRQDPDVVMVGEIRDAETAEIAIRAALTGHLVLSTLHTNDATSTVGRLLDMGVEPYLIAGAVRLVIAQRLVRRVCDNCAEDRETNPALKTELQLQNGCHRHGAGCHQCGWTGFSGRMPLFEVMPISETMAALISDGAPVSSLQQQATREGMKPLRDAAAVLVAGGMTTPEEALRATG